MCRCRHMQLWIFGSTGSSQSTHHERGFRWSRVYGFQQPWICDYPEPRCCRHTAGDLVYPSGNFNYICNPVGSSMSICPTNYGGNGNPYTTPGAVSNQLFAGQPIP